MNSNRGFVVVAAVLMANTHAPAAEEPDSAKAFLEAWAAAWQESGVDKMMDFYDTADETTAIESLGRVRKGPTEIRRMYQLAFDELHFDRVKLTPIVVGRHGSTAWATCVYRADMRLKSDQRALVLEVRGSFVMKREQDKWKIVLEHFSTIPDVPRVRPADER